MRSRILLALTIMVAIIGIANSTNIQPLATSNAELYTYRYIVELYDTGDSENLIKEIPQFYTQYPSSSYLPYVEFIEANLALEAGNNPLANKLYEELMSENLRQDVYGELLLNYSLSLKESKDYVKAMMLLQKVDSEIANQELSGQANIQRADIYNELGQYYSAKRCYEEALVLYPDNEDLSLSLFTTLLKLNQDTDAKALLDKQNAESSNYLHYVLKWLDYLLFNERYVEFDKFVATLVSENKSIVSPLSEIRIKRAVIKGDFDEAAVLLSDTKSQNPQIRFYDALIKLNKGEVSAADSMFKALVHSPDVGVSAYLERLKLLYKTEPLSAIVQLTNYLKDNPIDTMKAEMYYTLGYFCYRINDYIEAIKQLTKAKQYDMSNELSARIDILIAEAWFVADRHDMALESFNRYLNLYALGSARDKAWFYIGYIHFLSKNYSQSKTNFNQLLENHPLSAFRFDAFYYLGEIDFFLANYNLALQSYLKLIESKPDSLSVQLRISQTFYYLGDYSNCENYLAKLQPSYDVCILRGGVKMALKSYSLAYDQYLLAESFASDRLRKAETQSYQALCLYQMKRFKEASALYLLLSNEKESPDTYLFLSAKSAYAAKDYHQAIQLYDNFVDAHPDSPQFLAALGDIANSYYNLGNYERAVEDWINVLKRFRNSRQFSDSDLTSIRDALTGIDLGMKRFYNQDLIDELLVLPDTFDSEYIKFELNYILIKLYADNNEWAELINAAETIRANFPNQNKHDLDLLLATGLIELNQYQEAGDLLADVYSKTNSDEALLKWAELEYESHNYSSALAKYRISFEKYPKAVTWLKMLECSAADSYNDFDDIWLMGFKFKDEVPQSSIMRLNYFVYSKRLEDAKLLAEIIINSSVSTYDHARAFLILGMIDIQKEDYPTAIGTFKRVILLFPEFTDVRKQALYNTIVAQYRYGAYTEAEMLLLQYASEMDSEDVQELNQLLEGVK
jgi:tetratricopeptide (TPR) repeat protein